jgi:hypothetical protein
MVVSSKNSKKTAYELKCFEVFLNALGIDSGNGGAEVREPPEPDVLFHGKNGDVGFELVELCDSDIAQTNKQLLIGGGVKLIYPNAPTTEIIKNKLLKNYITPHPIELLCFKTNRIFSPDDTICYELNEAIASCSHVKFRRIWFCGERLYKIYDPNELFDLA